MKKNILGTHVVTQVGILVHDIEKTARTFADFLGVPSRRSRPRTIWTSPRPAIGATPPRRGQSSRSSTWDRPWRSS